MKLREIIKRQAVLKNELDELELKFKRLKLRKLKPKKLQTEKSSLKDRILSVFYITIVWSVPFLIFFLFFYAIKN